MAQGNTFTKQVYLGDATTTQSVSAVSGAPVAAGNTGDVVLSDNGFEYVYDGSVWKIVAATNGAGTSGQVLTSAGAGNAPTWSAAPVTSPGLPFNSIQYNNAGSFGGSANLTYNGTLVTVGVLGSTNAIRVDDTATAQQIDVRPDLISLTVPTGTSTVIRPTGIINSTPSGVNSGFTIDGRTVQIGTSAGTTTTAVSIGNSALIAGLTVDGGVSITQNAATINLAPTSELRINGAAGTIGQVLTSNGAGNLATWQAPANYSNYLGLLAITTAPTNVQLRDNPAFQCQAAMAGGTFTLGTPAAPLGGSIVGRQVTFTNVSGGIVTLTNGSVSRAMSADGGSVWVWVATPPSGVARWVCVSNV